MGLSSFPGTGSTLGRPTLGWPVGKSARLRSPLPASEGMGVRFREYRGQIDAQHWNPKPRTLPVNLQEVDDRSTLSFHCGLLLPAPSLFSQKLFYSNNTSVDALPNEKETHSTTIFHPDNFARFRLQPQFPHPFKALVPVS